MATFRYIAINKAGERRSGEIEGETRQDVVQRLTAIGDFPVEVVEATGSRKAATTAGTSSGGGLFSRGPKPEQITLFTRELAMLLAAGVRLAEALDMLAREASSPRLGRIIAGVRKSVTEGKSLNEALAATGAFPPVYSSMVQVAEATGTLPVVLERIAATREREQKLHDQAVSAMLYPAMLLTVAIGAILVMLVFVVPKFKEMLGDDPTKLPASTAFVIAASDWLNENFTTLGVGILGLLLVILLAQRTPALKARFEWLALRLPLVGTLTRTALAGRFCRTMGILLQNGIGLPKALELTRAVVGNGEVAGVIAEMEKALRQGRDFTGPLSGSWLFPSLVVNLMRVGQESGEIGPSALHLATMLEEKLEVSLKRLFTILEPAIILLVSLFVAGIIVSIISAVLSVNDLVL
jgi:general secretion pathway protein F